MKVYDKIMHNQAYLENAKKISEYHFISDGKWDWEHGLEHFKRVAAYIQDILKQLNADERTIELGITAALLHDMGLIKGEKKHHAIESSKIFTNFIDINEYTKEELDTIRQAIYDHSKGENIESLVGLSLVLADKLDVNYHRTINSTIHDEINTECNKIKKVTIKIDEQDLIVNYLTDPTFNVYILRNWQKAVTIPEKVAKTLKREFKFLVNDKIFDYEKIKTS